AGLDLADAGDQRLVGTARVALERAALLLQFIGRDVALGDGLADARLGVAAGEDRHAQGDADLGAAALAFDRAGDRGRQVTAAERAVAGGLAVAVAAAEVERRQVAGSRGRDVGLGRLDAELLRLQRRVVLHGGLDPA